MSSKAQRQAWIRDWLAQNHVTDACNSDFHEAYHQRFPNYRRKETVWGAQMVYQAQGDLREMYTDGILTRGRIGLGANWQPGFPKWVWGYSLK